MPTFKPAKVKTLIIISIALVFFVTGIHPIVTFDTFFGLKIGQDILSTGKLPFTETYSWAAFGRHWIPYEWLAQTWVAILMSLGGLKAIELYVAATIALHFILSEYLFYRVLSRSFIISTALSVFLTASIYEFIVARPQTIAYTCLMATLILLYDYLLRNRNRLYFLPAIAYIWTNSHGSFILLLFLIFACTFVVFVQKQLFEKQVFTTLVRWGFIVILVTLLPPLWHQPYLFLINFTKDIGFMTQFVSEWRGLYDNPTYQIYYVVLSLSAVAVGLVSWFKNPHVTKKLLLCMPLAGIALASFQALRHIPLGVISCLTIIGLIAPSITFRTKKLFIILVSLVLVTLSVFFVEDKEHNMNDSTWQLPSTAIDSDIRNIKNLHLQGHMFNEFAIGGYFLYYLPDNPVFFDGRADIYSCCEMRAFWPLITNKKADRATFIRSVATFLSTYDFSYMILPVYDYNPLTFTATSLMTDYLLDQPNWRLVYASDYLFVLVKNDGKNSDLFEQGYTSITPYRLRPYRKGEAQRAITEYQGLLNRQHSAIAYTGLGAGLGELKRSQEATEAYTNAKKINPNLPTTYKNLGSIYLSQGNLKQAQNELETALTKGSYLGEAYTLLATVYTKQGDRKNAQRVLEAGKNEQLDFLSKQQIIQMLYQLTR